jgi:RNA polymerase sigma factor (sigma-70 family)
MTAHAVDVVSSPHAVEEAYRLQYELLLHISTRRFSVPRHDAEGLVHEVFVSYLASSHEIRDARAYLVGAICNASRYYWRSHGRLETLPSDFDHRTDPSAAMLSDSMATRITISETIKRLHEKCQKTLRLKYWDGCSAAEVAAAFSTTNRYAEKLIHKCLKKAHEIYNTLNGVGRA